MTNTTMTKPNDGGPAFPESYSGDLMPNEGIGGGMTLRDYFAAKAMQSLIVSPATALTIPPHTPYSPSVAEMAYRMADAMIAARN